MMKTAICLFAAFLLLATSSSAGPVYSVTDISHAFSFYFDGRFAREYYDADSRDVRNWGALNKCDLKDANLLVLATGSTPCRYSAKDMQTVRFFLESGGGVVVLGDCDVFPGEEEYHVNTLLDPFGAVYLDKPLVMPLRVSPSLDVPSVTEAGGKVIELRSPAKWEVLISDAEGNVAMARRRFELGTIVVCSRSLVGGRPDATDAINAALWKPLLTDAARGKTANPLRHPQRQPPEYTTTRGGLRIQYNEYLRPYAETIFGLYKQCEPEMETIMGVPAPRGMLTRLLLLPTDGGGYMSDTTLAIGAFSRGFPKDPYGFVEMLGHETSLNWTVPFPEPMWSEALPTYVGILLGRKLGYKTEADAALNGWISAARETDPTLTKTELRPESHPSHAVAMGKALWVWEHLRSEKPDIVARYVQAKRRLINPSKRKAYTSDDSVAILSDAMGRDLFPWFRSIGVHVEESRTSLPLP